MEDYNLYSNHDFDYSSKVIKNICCKDAFNTLEYERLRKFIALYHGDRSLFRIV